MHPASLWKPLGEGRAQCRLCCHFCLIDPGARGRCGVRVNRDGALFTLVWDRVAALNVDPVEKKPLYHFLPGSLTFSFGTMGCNLGCSFCQNASLSQPPRQGSPVEGRKADPEGLVQAALDSGCRSVSYTYSEPTVFFELMAAAARRAKAAGLANIMVTNGFMSPECLDALAPLVDAANVDLKAFTPAFYEQVCEAKLEPVKRNIRRMRELGWWIELTTLVIPGLNDSPGELSEMARFIVEQAGAHTPWHLSRFHPDFRLTDRPPTPESTLETAWKIGKDAGLEHVYVGNLPGNAHNATLCPGCGAVAVERRGFALPSGAPPGGVCPGCGRPLAGRFD
ncbi:Putative glycyl-radical enzyme activating enzyme YjjW [Fundidesulfovibrio magnetotacticus]|uniref:Glycyl-radical enzyme activating enzyme YjjW n=1 Tax=Fundidesulfovibrio magnetotacticus TaxID=2730080 RepID=A0A6V8LPC5_9BACT|nr:AmmeMemoRadiSam system radical SAM enzyme [Fundidesulfovibrio magnetotacticus]GFK93574.1 Putative glycyl-radical enzyme activating enzyme YjjW [Fundidesulfovibrio magnetotacticus]